MRLYALSNEIMASDLDLVYTSDDDRLFSSISHVS